MTRVQEHTLLAVVLITIGALFRVLPHPANVAPITAIALFGGVYLQGKRSFLLPALSLLLSDVLLGFYGSLMFFVYGAFLLEVGIGKVLKRHVSLLSVTAVSLICSLVFFVISNTGVWVTGNAYSKDLQGLVTCLIAGLPFLRNTIVGDMGYTFVLFGSFMLLRRIRFSQLLPKRLLGA